MTQSNKPILNGWTPPERIWLHDLGCGEVTWCEDPDPDGEQIEAVEYIRADMVLQYKQEAEQSANAKAWYQRERGFKS